MKAHSRTEPGPRCNATIRRGTDIETVGKIPLRGARRPAVGIASKGVGSGVGLLLLRGGQSRVAHNASLANAAANVVFLLTQRTLINDTSVTMQLQ